MILEAVDVVVIALLLTIIGWGPSLWLLPRIEKRMVYALGSAPAVGFSIIALIGFPLVRYIAPVRVWALPATIALVVLSLVLVALHLRTVWFAFFKSLSVSATLVLFGFVLVSYVALVSPVLVLGMQYAAFRGNPNDAYVYQSLAETVRVADWQTIQNGIQFSKSNIEGVRHLAEISPTSLYIVRAINLPLTLSQMSALAWASQITGVVVERFYMSFQLLMLALSLPISLVIGDVLELPRLVKYLAAAGIVFGFWTRFVLENDSAYQLSVFPLVLLAVFAWMVLEQRNKSFVISAPVLLFALASAAIAMLYVPVATVIVAAIVCYAFISILPRTRPLSFLIPYVSIGILVLVILAGTGQIDSFLKISLSAAQRADSERLAGVFGMDLIQTNGVGAVWGLPSSIIDPSLPNIVQRLLPRAAQVLGLLLTGILSLTTAFVISRATPAAHRIVFSIIAGGLVVMLIYFAEGNVELAGKMFTYSYPFLIFGTALFTYYARRYFRPTIFGLATAVVVAWLLGQFALGIYLPYAPRLGGFFAWANANKPEHYDLTPITNYLDQHPPRLLLVNVPKDTSITVSRDPRVWTFAYYSMFVFSHYHTYFQTGLVTDNSSVPNLWLEQMTAVPDYTVVLKRADYIGPENLGTRVAETSELALYRISVQDLTAFLNKENEIREDGWWQN